MTAKYWTEIGPEKRVFPSVAVAERVADIYSGNGWSYRVVPIAGKKAVIEVYGKSGRLGFLWSNYPLPCGFRYQARQIWERWIAF
jgi:hypothetical protein